MRVCVGVVLLVMMGTLGGCAEVGVAGDVVTSAGSAGKELFVAGKQETCVAVPWEQVVDATRTAAGRLGLRTVEENVHPEQRKLTYVDDRKQKIVVTVVRRTASATEIHVDTGLFGMHGMGRLTISEMLRDMPLPADARRRADEDAR